jgi:hypothetical protein
LASPACRRTHSLPEWLTDRNGWHSGALIPDLKSKPIRVTEE